MIDIWVVGSIQVGGTFWDQIEAGAKAAGEMIADAKVTYIAPEEYSYPNIDAMIQTAVAANRTPCWWIIAHRILKER
ncbi:MAG: hypothetical protein CM1200mP26_17630 [Acidimicrobiales bacterium]|nr:MAG: hypothetical protein CM1200mP26_17630 [Acidimicrobiales bacterium]